MKRFFFLLLLYLNVAPSLEGQPAEMESQIFATVQDEAGNSIPIGNALLFSAADSSMITAEVFYDGKLSLSVPGSGEQYLQLSALGYEDLFSTLTTTSLLSAGGDLGVLTLRPRFLDAVEVFASKKMVEQRGTDVILNVANTPLSNSGSATDLLRNAPKVSLDRNGGLSIIGRGAAVVYLDGRLVSTPEVLNSLSAQDIQRVEILENPSARYEAAGNAVINIVTRQYSLAGYKIGLVQEVGQGQYFRSTSRLRAYRKFAKVFLQGSYGYRSLGFGSYYRQSRRLLSAPSSMLNDNQYFLRNNRRQHDYDFRIGYSLGAHNELTAQYTGSFLSAEKRGDNLRSITDAGNPILEIKTLVTGPTKQRNGTLNLSNVTTLDSLGSELRFSAQYATFGLDRNETINQEIITEQSNTSLVRFSGNQNEVAVYSMRGDYLKKWRSETSLELGFKLAKIQNNSAANLREPGEDGSLRILDNFTNDFSYREAIQAAYGSLTTKVGQGTLTTGLRAERTINEGLANSRDYLNFFPSLSFSKPVGEAQLNFGYAHRITRPIFQDLNPYVLYVDSLVSLRGNPNLLPEYSHQFSLGGQWKQWNFSLSYIYTKDKINQLFRSPDPSNPEVVAFVKENLEHTKLYSATVSRSVNYRSFSAYLSIGTFFDDHRVQDVSDVLDNTSWGYILEFNPTIQLPDKWSLAAYMKYTSPRIDGVYQDNAISYVNLSLSRKFFKGRLKATLWSNDVFKKFWFTGFVNFGGMQADYISRWDLHYTKLVLTWNFGKLSSEVKSRRDRAELNRINQAQ